MEKKKKFFVLSILVLFIVLTFSYLVLYSSSIKRPNVILIEICSLRAENLPCYGYDRDTAPNICELAEDGVLFNETMSTATSTPIGVPSLLTGNEPLRHGMRSFDDVFTENHTTLFDTLSEQDYYLKGYAHDMPYAMNLFESKNVDLCQDFDNCVNDLDDTEEPFLFKWHSVDVHFASGPGILYPSPDYKGTYPLNESFNETYWFDYIDSKRYMDENITLPDYVNEYLVNRYDESIRFADNRVGKVIDQLKANDMYDDSMIIITSDHGEGFGENHLSYHGGPPYEELIHIPLIIKFPDNEYSGSNIEGLNRITDIYPTVKDYMNLDDKDTDGDSLIPLIEGKEPNRTIYGHFESNEWVRSDEWKYIENVPNIGNLLYNLEDDPYEDYNLADEKRDKVQNFESLITEYRETVAGNVAGEGKLSDVEKDRLRDLGYLD